MTAPVIRFRSGEDVVLTVEIDENAGPEVGCLDCRLDVDTRYSNDYRNGGYLYCDECMEPLVWGC